MVGQGRAELRAIQSVGKGGDPESQVVVEVK